MKRCSTAEEIFSSTSWPKIPIKMTGKLSNVRKVEKVWTIKVCIYRVPEQGKRPKNILYKEVSTQIPFSSSGRISGTNLVEEVCGRLCQSSITSSDQPLNESAKWAKPLLGYFGSHRQPAEAPQNCSINLFPSHNIMFSHLFFFFLFLIFLFFHFYFYFYFYLFIYSFIYLFIYFFFFFCFFIVSSSYHLSFSSFPPFTKGLNEW